MSNPADARRRWFGLFFLFLAGGMLIWGETLLKPHLGRGIGFILYWLACFALTGLAILVALLDFWIVRRRARQDQQQMIENAMRGVQKDREPS
jgi:hypothetical protein